MRPPSFSKAVVWILFFGIILPVAGGVILDVFLMRPVWIYPPFHAVVEGGGAFAAFALAFLILLSEKHRVDPVYGVWSLCALLGMGILDLFHAVSSTGNNFVWLHSLAILVGGLFFALTWVPSRFISPRMAQGLPRLVVVMTVGTVFFSLRFSEAVPVMVSGGNFSMTARGLNIAAGLFFSMAAVRFMTLYRARPDWLELMMAGLCALSGAAGILFEYSRLWCPVWWWWHCLRLLAYFIVVWFIVLFYQRVMEELRETNVRLERSNNELQRETQERKDVQDKLRQTNELSEKILGTIPLAMDIVDEDGRILYVNRVLETIVGTSAIGQRCWSVYKDDKNQCTDCPLRKGIPAGQIKSLEVGGAFGGRAFQIFHAGMVYGGKRAVLEVFQDVTERKHNEEELNKLMVDLQRRLEQLKTSRMAALNLTQDIEEARKQIEKSRDVLAHHAQELDRSNKELEQFAYVASHDLQEPLRMVASYVQLLARRYQGRLDADADEFIGFAVDGAKRMKDLLNDLLTFSRVGTRAKELALMDCEKALEAAMQNLQPAIVENGVEITRDPLPKVRADDIQMVQVFQNLIANAIKFRKKDTAPRVHISCRPEGKVFVFSVTDNGIGIAPEHYEKIFQIFQRLYPRDEYPGSGIGLAVCKKIVERHGGRIWVESAPDKGSVFYFSLPGS
ncbi:MAG: hypothetical protein A3G91_04545 [Omnitrophica WOR_2 bacterium RIFCSPLOWO2_12_FULL_50_9]|nr:MAG: hypothetical protein A3G91_04545 [Omnitrophica WOR_2 bacterium RIFCSPLOWO2_12_FULL_50_9]